MLGRSLLLSVWVVTPASRRDSPARLELADTSLADYPVFFFKVLTYRTFEPSCHTLTRLTKKERSWKKQNALRPYKLSSFFLFPSIICVHMACRDTLRNRDLCRHPVWEASNMYPNSANHLLTMMCAMLSFHMRPRHCRSAAESHFYMTALFIIYT